MRPMIATPSISRSRHFGEIPGVAVGAIFPDRRALHDAGVHRPLQAGISGTQDEGADSIVLSGGYEDDIDDGEVIVYTGHGGKDPDSKRQIADQELKFGNRALARSCVEGLPVRVIRGAGELSPFAPSSGYQYAGLYRVERYWCERGKSGFLVWRYRLVQDPDPVETDLTPPFEMEDEVARRPSTSVQRIVRNGRLSQKVKELHDHQCQMCGVRLETPGGPYAEGAFIRPLGKPHNGPMSTDNLLCLCPNHHVLFNLGSIVISDELLVTDVASGQTHAKLRTVEGHSVDPSHLAYHRRLFVGSA